MLRAATEVAETSDYDALVTGEAVGQVSSQTLRNLAVISKATPLTILRPLVGANKDEIIGLARHIGTEEASAQVEEYCALTRKSPATAAKLDALVVEEAQLPHGLLDGVLESAQRLDLRSTEIDFESARENAVDKVPPGAVVLDVRPRALFEGFPPRRCPLPRVESGHRSLRDFLQRPVVSGVLRVRCLVGAPGRTHARDGLRSLPPGGRRARIAQKAQLVRG